MIQAGRHPQLNNRSLLKSVRRRYSSRIMSRLPSTAVCDRQLFRHLLHSHHCWKNSYRHHQENIWTLIPASRYYGSSMPFGDRSLDSAHIGYLTSSQALADYAELINFLQGDTLRPKYPVIAFGGTWVWIFLLLWRFEFTIGTSMWCE